MNNIFIYNNNDNDNDNEYDINKLFRNLIYLHTTIGKNCNIHILNDNNITQYIDNIPDNLKEFKENKKINYIKYNVLYKWGGIWINNNILLIKNIDYLFNNLVEKEGFIIINNNKLILDIFGSNANNELLSKLLDLINIDINEIYIIYKDIFANYNIISYDNDIIIKEETNKYISLMYEDYKKLDNNQKLMVFDTEKLINIKTEDFYILKNPINYFIKKSFDNLKHLDDIDFIEIGTSHFDTLIQERPESEKGISIDAVKYYIDSWPFKYNVKKLNIGISDKRGIAEIYYIPANIIKLLNLPEWYYGCNSLNKYHPYHIENNLEKYVSIDRINIIPTYELFYTNKIRKVKFLKIDTEGHDLIILKSLYGYIKYLPKIFYPDKIIFEAGGDTNKVNTLYIDEIINEYCEIGYKLINKQWDVTLILE